MLSDEGRRKRYDETGRTDERFAGAEEMGWDAYFEGLYKRVDRKILDEDKKKYQGELFGRCTLDKILTRSRI